MNWFGKRQAAPPAPDSGEVATLRAECAALASEVRTLRLEWADASDRLYRWMKRGEAAARKVEAAGDGPTASAAEPPEIEVGTPLTRRQMWGARGRRALRLQASGTNGAGAEGES